MKAASLLVTVLLLHPSVPAHSQQSPLTPPGLNPTSRPGVLKVGDKAPAFSLPNGDGKLVSLSDLTAKSPLVVVFYRGFW